MPTREHHAFSLIELLVVIAVIALIVTIAVPATQSLLRSSALNTGIGQLSDAMSSARQHALTHSRAVEVRFYRYGDPETPGEVVSDPKSGHFRAFQSFDRSDSGLWLPIGPVVRLPDLTVMSMGERLSTIIGEDYASRVVDQAKVQSDPVNHVELPRKIGLQYEYIAFRFLPGGGTDLSPMGAAGKDSQGGRWHITLHSRSDLPRTLPPAYSVAPPNYATWMVDPLTGIGKVFRPGLE